METCAFCGSDVPASVCPNCWARKGELYTDLSEALWLGVVGFAIGSVLALGVSRFFPFPGLLFVIIVLSSLMGLILGARSRKQVRVWLRRRDFG